MPTTNNVITKDVVIKVKKDDVKLNQIPYVFKGDRGMIFQISVQNWNYYFEQSSNAEVDIFTGCKAKIEIIQPDSSLVKIIDVPIIDNEVYFKINSNLSQIVGEYKVFIEILKGNEVLATIPPFTYIVKDKPDFTNVLPSNVGLIKVSAEDNPLLCYDTLDDYGIRKISELPKTNVQNDIDEMLIQTGGITKTILVGDFLKTTREELNKHADNLATAIRGEISTLDTEHKTLVSDTKAELTNLINTKDKAQTDALASAKTELNNIINTKHTEAKSYTDAEIVKAKGYSDTNLATAKSYADTKVTETLASAKGYSDTKLTEAKQYSDQKLTEANSHSDTNLVTAKGYTDTEIGKAKTEVKGYSDTNLQTAKDYTNAEILKVNGTATSNLAEAKKYTDDKLVEGKGYTDQKIKDVVGLAPPELDTLKEIGDFATANKGLIDGFVAQLGGKSDLGHRHDNATDLADGFMSKEDFAKLKGVAVGANNYTHPKTHSANIIVQDATHRFVSDADKEKWTNLKLDNVSIEGQEIVFKSENVEKFRLPLPKGFSGDYNDLTNKPKPYELPMASDTVLGGIKLGIGFEKLADGTVNIVTGGKADSVEWSGILNVPTEFNPTIATTTKLGGIKVGDGLSIGVDGTLSANVKQIDWGGIQNKPSDFTPSKHNHTKSEITDLFTVENALTSNSTTNALSVAQGKAIDDKVNTLKNEHDTTKSEVGTLKTQTTQLEQSIKTLETDTTNLKGNSHTHTNATELAKVTDGKVASWDSKAEGIHNHTLSNITDMFSVENVLTSTSTTNALSSAQGKVLNDKITQLEQGVSSVHTHTNKATLDKITEGNLTDWSAKETTSGSQAKADKALQDAKTYIDNKVSSELVNKTYVGTISNWVSEGSLFKATVNHNLNVDKIIVTCLDNVKKENILISYKIINLNTIEIYIDNEVTVDIMVVGGNLTKVEQSIGAEIKDTESSTTTTYSSNKIDSLVANAKPNYQNYEVKYNSVRDSLDFVYNAPIV